jgi:hypothetical protein
MKAEPGALAANYIRYADKGQSEWYDLVRAWAKPR